MIKNGYEEKIVVKYSEIDQNLAMKPFALLNFLQDIASKNAEDLGFGYSYIHPRNYAWFLIKYRMEFEDYPFDVQELTLKTEPRGYNKLFAFRDFEFYKDIHRHLFYDIYEWAGVVRSVNLSKKGTAFCEYKEIDELAEKRFERLKKDNFLVNVDIETFVDEFTDLYVDLNYLHPFREGNGRHIDCFLLYLHETQDMILTSHNVTLMC